MAHRSTEESSGAAVPVAPSAAAWADCLHDIPTGVCIIEQGRLTHLNPAAGRLLGLEAQRLAGHPQLAERIHPDDRQRVVTQLAKIDASHDAQTLEFRVLDRDDRVRNLALHLAPSRADNGTRLVGTLTDVTLMQARFERIELTATVFDNIREGVVVCDRDGVIRMVNPAFTAITGYSEHQALGQNPRLLKSGRHGPAFYCEMWRILEDNGHWEGEIWNQRRGGEVYPEYLKITAIRDSAGSPRHYIGVFADITHRKLSDDRLQQLVRYDTLTELPNRETLRQQLKNRMVQAMVGGNRLAVIYIDIDHFKSINESMGHAAGDSLLRVVAERLKNVLRDSGSQRPSDTLARLGSDEFVVLVDELLEAQHAATVAEKLLERIQAPISLGGFTLHVDASLGIAIYPDDAESVDDLLRHADMAMHHVKQKARGSFHFFSPQMRDLAQRQLQLRSALHNALERGQFHLVFQPQIGAVDGKVHCVEALLRWRSPELGEIPANEFIPILEQSGDIERIGRWVIDESIRCCMEWQRQSPIALRVSVNLSARQLRNGLIVDQIAEALRNTGLPPSCLELELTESLAMQDVNVTQQTLGALHQVGIRIAIDDFGTGYSSLSYLQHFRLDVLKIDQSFVGRCVANRQDQAIIRATLALAHSMGLEVVAEGVETAAQAAFLTEHGADLLQGYLLSRPAGFDEVAALIRERNPGVRRRLDAPAPSADADAVGSATKTS